VSAAARTGPRRPPARARYTAPLLPAAGARLVAFAPLVAFCALMWSRVLEPARVAAMLGAAALALATAVALTRVRGRWTIAVAVVALAGALLIAGVPARTLWPGAWDELLPGLAGGLGDLPATSAPYRGSDPWIASALLLIGTLIALLAAWLGFAPGRSGERQAPVRAAVVLGVMFTVPAVQVEGAHPWLEGGALAVLLCAFLWLERIERQVAPIALGVVLAAGLAAGVAAPRLDAGRPLLDYEALARSLGPARGLTFAWNHSYGALHWPRTGREVLRIRAQTASYWKVENLSRFDGLRWVEPRELGPTPQEASLRRARPEWGEQIHVRVRGMMTRLFVGAGTTLGIEASPRTPIRNAPGTFRTGPRPLHSGQAYDADVWLARPSRRQLRNAGGEVPAWTWPYLRMDLPAAQGGPSVPAPAGSALTTPGTAQVEFADYGSKAQPTVDPPRGVTERPPAGDVMRRSAYGGVYRLAQRLKGGTDTPYEYVQRVLDHLADGYAYSETPPASQIPIASFLLKDREGYCQQFSGAMALLLRMGGVPARVSAGFSPGTFDKDTGEYVVRDTDAHSWVEAYLAPYGWVTFDPTPPIGPARLDPGAGEANNAYQLGASAGALGVSERSSDRSIDSGPAAGSSPLRWIALGAAVALLAAAAGLLAWWLARRRAAGPPVDAALAELHAALRGTGRSLPPDVTLHTMLHRYRNTPAEPYLRTLEAARFGGADVVPTPEMRAALRRELSLGLGPGARLGAWLALPPARARHSRARSSYPDPR
jgi:transglutaminase-like putative cysteine protease